MARELLHEPISDGASPYASETDVNGARTAVGVPHPENRLLGQSLPMAYLPTVELDDYDDGRLAWPDSWELPPDQDVGESFPDVVDVGETPQEHQSRADRFAVPPAQAVVRPMVDNQVNQPERFHNPRSK